MPGGNRTMLKWNQNREFNNSLEMTVLDLDHSVAIIPVAQMRVVGGECTLVDEANTVGRLVLWSRLTCKNKIPIQFVANYLPDSSVADRGCLSRIRDPEFYPSRIPDPKTATKEGWKKLLHNLLCRHKFRHIKIIFSLEVIKDICIWDSGCSQKHILDPVSRGQKATGSLIPDPQHCQTHFSFKHKWGIPT